VPSSEPRGTVSVGLVYQAEALNAHLKLALSEFGARVVYDASVAKFDYAALDAAGPEVVVVNLDPEVEEEMDHLDALLVDDTRRVVFNDAEVSSKLGGWEQARWARHLAAKILGVDETHPPRPTGSQAVPVRSRPSAPEFPGATGASAGFEISADDLARALDADTRAMFERDRAELHTSVEPVAPMIEDRLAALKDDQSFDLPISAAEMMDLFGDASAVPTAAVGATADTLELEPFDEGPAAPASRPEQPEEFEAAGLGFTFLESPDDAALTVPSASLRQVAAAPPEAEWAGLALAPIEEEVELVDNDGFSEASPASTAALSPAASRTGDSEWGDLGALSLEPISEGPAVVEVQLDSARSPSFEEFDLGALELAPIEDEAPPEAVPAAAVPARPAAGAPPSSLVTTLELPVPALAPAAAAAPTTAPARAEPPAPAPAPAPTPVPELSGIELPGIDFDFEEAASAFRFSDFQAAAEAAAPTPAAPDDDLMRQFQAIFNDEEFVASANTGPIRNVWVLGASIGGPEAVREFLGALPPTLPVVFLLAQHMGSDFLELMTQQLAKATKLRVRHVHDGDLVAYGDLVVVPLDQRLRVAGTGEVRVSALEQVSSYTPSIDMVLKDVADHFGASAGTIVFSGMAHDAIEGARYLQQKGGVVWAQDPKTCVVSSMVDGVCSAGIVEFVGSPAQLAKQFASRFPG